MEMSGMVLLHNDSQEILLHLKMYLPFSKCIA